MCFKGSRYGRSNAVYDAKMRRCRYYHIHSEYFKNYFAFFNEARKANAQTKKNYMSLYKSFRKDAEVIFDLTTWCKRNEYDDEVEKMLSDN